MYPGFPESSLDAEARRGWIRSNIPRATWETVTGAEILAELRELGVGIRTQDFYGIRREVLQLGMYEERLSVMPVDQLIPKAWMHEREDIDLTLKAQYRFKLSVTDLDTGEESIITRAISSNQHWTREEAEDFIRGLFTLPSAASNYRVEEASISEVWVRPGAILER